jgi:two-component system, chemotaxis family, CheB/CheR fusion protein
MSTSDEPRSRAEATSPRLVVGIGASAGGLHACKQFLERMPRNSGMAFVIVVHLDPVHHSHLPELLRAVTEMEVVQVTSSLAVEPNHVYVIAPNTELTLRAGVLEPTPARAPYGSRATIDHFFASLAADQGKRAAAIVLSGTGNDGSAGLEAIHGRGGLCLVQSPESAEHVEMPRHAAETGVVDRVLSPAEMPDALQRRAGALSGGSGAPEFEPEEVPEAFAAVLSLLGERHHVDFRGYKRGTLERRAQRRMHFARVAGWPEYLEYLHDHPDELDALYRDMLIGVTSFFREPEAWEYLAEHVVPELVRTRELDVPVRAWAAGCATGEEAYTLAMVLIEAFERAGRYPHVRIYATDVNAEALASARRGVFPPSIASELSPDRLDRFFDKRGEEFAVKRHVREVVTFAEHDLTSDPPFPRLDVITCRNVLIYLLPPVQERVLEVFRFALQPRGVLMLGGSENIGGRSELFETLSKRLRVYRASAAPRSARYAFAPKGANRSAAVGSTAFMPGATRKSTETARAVERAVLQRHTEACVAIDDRFEILYFFGPTQNYLTQPAGEARLDLLSWARPSLHAKLRAALQLAVTEKRSVSVTDLRIEREGAVQRVETTIEPLGQGVWLVSFRDVAPSAALPSAPEPSGQPLALELAGDLQRAQEELQRTVEQLDRADADHRIANEELLSLNEELQSSNEELETSKEELQSLNEEMNTINRELEERNAQLRSTNTDLRNLLESTAVPTIFLDREFRITFFTPAATELMRLVPADIGRSVRHIKERFSDERLLADAGAVLQRLAPVSAEVQTDDGRWYVRRIVPYRAEEERIDGVCITFSDVTELKAAMALAEHARDYAEAIIRTIRTPLLVLDVELKVLSANDAFYETFDVTPDQCLGRRVYDLGNGQWNIPRLRDLLEKVLPEAREVRSYDVEHVFERIGWRFMRLNARAMGGPGHDGGILVSIEDMTEWKNAETEVRRHAEALRNEHRRKDQFLAMLGHELRNPLAAVSYGIELLAQGPDQARVDEIRSMMARHLSRVMALLDQLLDVARVVSGKITVVKEPVDLTEVTKTVLEAVRPAIAARKQELVTKLAPPGVLIVAGDAMRLTQVIENLLTNASKYTQAGGTIWLTTERQTDTVDIRVRDSGTGIEPALLPHVFDLFTQAPRSAGGTHDGLGLGLALVRSLVDLHGGEVSASSGGLGQGSEFVVRLPAIRASEMAVGEQQAPRTAVRQPLEERPRRVLVVDDEIDLALALAEILQHRGHEAKAVHSAEAALEAIEGFRPDIVLLDIGLPDMDGYSLAMRIRAEHPRADLCLVAVTGYGKDIDRLAAAGFDRHIIKPIDINALRDALGARSSTTPEERARATSVPVT